MVATPTGIAEPVGVERSYPRAVRATPPDGTAERDRSRSGPILVQRFGELEVLVRSAEAFADTAAGRVDAAGAVLSSGGAEADAATAEADRFRATMRNHPAGVVVITAGVEGRPVGLTTTSFTSVSLDPPLVSFYVADSSSTWPTLRLAGEFGVQLLSEKQADLATRFAPPTSWRPGPADVPLLDGAAAHLVCERFDTRLIGDHWLVVGQVTHTVVLQDPRPPLVYHQGSFSSVAPLD